MEKNHFEQAKIWLDAAILTGDLTKYESNKYAVGTAMLVHAIIKANDALAFKFFGRTARKHDEARQLFHDLIKQNVLKSEYSSYAQIIQDAISNKAKAEYRGAYFSKNDFEEMKRKTEKFIKMAGGFFL